jgi:hypothetical protein
MSPFGKGAVSSPMTFRAQILGSSIAGAAFFAMGCGAADCEPLGSLQPAQVRSAQTRSTQMLGVSGLVTSPHSPARVVSATHRLDLSKLTMADFGDTDPSR